jgi:lipopolysaccharide export system protein LptC
MTTQADIIRDQRRAFAAPGGFHDRLVHFLSRALPIGIGVVAAVMILSPLSPRGEISFLLDRNKVAVTSERLRVDNAMYRGKDDQNRPFSVTAGSAVQAKASEPVVRMENLVARMLLADGPAELTARNGSYDFRAEQVQINGPVDFRTADGYRMLTDGVSIDLKGQRIVGSGGVSGAIPAGTFSADRLIANLTERTVMLDGNARLRMEPGKLRIP